MTQLGKATGPQKKPRRSAVQQEMEQSEWPAEENVTEATPDPDQPVVAGNDALRARQAWDSTVQRMSEEAQRVVSALENIPAGTTVRTPLELPVDMLRDLEAGLVKVRLGLEQTGDLVL